MQISLHWLNDYLPQQIAPDKLSNILTSIGLEVEGQETRGIVPGGLQGVVTGYVVACRPHEHADKLKVATVRVQEDKELSIVCGAPNIAAGQKVMVATVGSVLPTEDGKTFKIKKAKLRGESSEGMICAEDELGIGNNHEGIMVLPEDTPVGLSAADYFRIDADIIFTIGLTPNRSDANSHLGTAKDVCAYLSYHQKEKISPIYPELITINTNHKSPVKVSIENQQTCLRYTGLVVSGITVAPSPAWLQERLLSVGIHPVNNIVDITNFVLQEYGQPLHAFDYDTITGQSIIVKNLPEQTPFTTLDHKDISLSSEDLMICDGDGKPMCMAGVYGGLTSGISETTRTVFLESAYFTPRSIRRSSVRHQLRTDAATHFEKGVAMDNILPALKRAAGLIKEIAGGGITSDIIDIYPNPQPDKKIILRPDYLNKICGKEFHPDAVSLLLEALGFSITADDKGNFIVSVPFEHQDIHQPADLAEEVLRIDGLDNIPIPKKLHYTLHHNSNPNNDFRELKERLAQYLAYSGLQEIMTNSITNSNYYPEQNNMVHLMNSLSSELDVLRPEMLAGGLEVMAYNLNRKITDLHLFEIGKTYEDTGQYKQTEWLSIWSTGNIQPPYWAAEATPSDIYVLKGIVTALCSLAGLKKVQEEVRDGQLVWQQGKRLIARLYTVSPADKKRFGIKQEVYYAGIHLENLFHAVGNRRIQHSDPPRYPTVKRDLALILPKSVAYEQVATIARRQKLEALREFQLFDIFEHEKIGKDNKSMALSFTFQLKERTLTDAEVDGMMQQLVNAYEKELQATLRS